MLFKRSATVLAVVFATAFATAALALNPQPEPPSPYRGYEIVITPVDQFRWRWEIYLPHQGSQHTVVESGYVRGTHLNAEQKARVRIDKLATHSGSPIIGGPMVKAQTIPKLFFGIDCDNRLGTDPATGHMSMVLRLTVTGTGSVPAGTHIVWTIYGHPPMEGEYVFESAVWPKQWVDVAYQPPQHGNDYAHAPCYVHLKP